MSCGVYKIVNMVTGECYLGSSVDIPQRWRCHVSQLSRGNHHSLKLQRSFVKHGFDAFEFVVVELCSKSELLDREQHWIGATQYKNGKFGAGYNMNPTAGSNIGRKWSAETKAKIAAAGKGNTYNTGRKLSEPRKQQIRESYTESMREQLVQRNKARAGLPMSEIAKSKLSNTNKGKPKSEPARLKMSQAWTPERKAALAIRNKERSGII